MHLLHLLSLILAMKVKETVSIRKKLFKVDLYELRSDPRAEGAAAGRSINLTMSHRARRALRRIGMEEECLAAGVP